MLRRPAAAIEDLRRSVAQNPPRILLLENGKKSSTELLKFQALLALAGFSRCKFTPMI